VLGRAAVVLVAATGLAACSASPTATPVAGSQHAPATPATTAPGPAPTPTSSPTASGTATAAPRPTPAGKAPTCAENQLGAVETRNGSSASQPFSVVKVVNASHRACALGGYPHVVFWAQSAYRLVRLSIAVTNGSIYEVPDPGPTRFLLAPGASAWFAVGTGTAYGGPYRRLTYLTIYPTARTSGVGVLCGVNLSTDSPAGRPIPVAVTAFAPGSGPTA